MELRIYLNLLRRWAWLLILGVGLGVTAGYIFSLYQDPLYQSSTRVLVMRAPEEQTSNLSQSTRELAQTFIQLLGTRPVLDAAAQRLGYPVRVDQIDVQLIGEAQLIRITIQDANPQRAADIANALVDVFIEYNEGLQASRFASSEESLLAQLQQVEQQISILQGQVTDFSAENLDDQAEFVANTISDLQAEILMLQEEIVVLNFSEEPYTARDYLGRLVFVTATPSIEQRVDLANKRDRMAELESLLSMYQSIFVDLSIARQSGTGGGSRISEQMQAALVLYQQIYSNLLNNYEAVRLARLRSTPNIVQVEEALPPVSPIRPRPFVNMALGGIVGLFLAGGIGFVIEYLDDTLRTQDEVAGVLQLPILGLIGEMKGPGLIKRAPRLPFVIERPRSPIAEAFRSLRANLEFAEVDHPLKTLLVTSPGLSEGKTAVAVNLAIVMAQTGRRVVLVDADLRRPQIHEVLQLPNRRGLSEVLRGRTRLETVHQAWKHKNLIGVTTPDADRKESGPVLQEALAVLRWKDPARADQEHILRKGDAITIGHDPKNDVVIQGSQVLRRQAMIAYRDPGYEISELGGSNGTEINEAPLQKTHKLKDGDRIRIDNVELVFSNLSETERGKYNLPSSTSAPLKNAELTVITSGHLPPNPAEVLSSARMAQILKELEAKFDIVVIDAPPFLLADASVLSARVDGVLAVIRANYTQATGALVMLEQLQRAGARVVGLAINRIRRQDPKYYYRGLKGYTSFSYDYPEEDGKKAG